MSHVPAWLAEGVAMQPGAGRILTTHSGSLPRPSRFLSLVLAQEAGESVDEAQFADEVRAAVRETVRLQADAGVDVLNDGEMGKPSLPLMSRIG
jgi:5-methyltetrahydropteroyltriglutamate--homocysteine methyltransferase